MHVDIDSTSSASVAKRSIPTGCIASRCGVLRYVAAKTMQHAARRRALMRGTAPQRHADDCLLKDVLQLLELINWNLQH